MSTFLAKWPAGTSTCSWPTVITALVLGLALVVLLPVGQSGPRVGRHQDPGLRSVHTRLERTGPVCELPFS